MALYFFIFPLLFFAPVFCAQAELYNDTLVSLSKLYFDATLSDEVDASYPKLPSNLSLSILPPLWTEIKTLNRINYRVNKDGHYIVDVFDYAERMSLYKYFIDNIRHCEWKSSWANSTSSMKPGYDPGNILWGLPLQHGWQFSSGRLLTTPGSTKFSSEAWWGDMNFFLSVIPYFGAVEAGLAPPISLKENPNPQIFCGRTDDCPEVVQPWVNFFTLVNSTANSCTTKEQNLDSKHHPDAVDFSPHTPLGDRLNFNLTNTMERLLDSLWKAHIHSIRTALPLFEDKLQLMDAPEAQFGRSWAGLVDLIAESLFPCNLTTTDVLQNLLPPRILRDGDKAPMIPDITRLQNRAVFLINGIYNLNVTSSGRVEEGWLKMMCTEEGRALGREMMTLGLYRPVYLVEDGIELLKMVKNQPGYVECGVAGETGKNGLKPLGGL